MVLGVCIIELHLPENHSLKGKRQIIRRLKDRLRNNFNISVAEVGHQDLWQRASLGIAYVCNDRRRTDQVINQALNFVERQNLAVITNYDIEIVNY